MKQEYAQNEIPADVVHEPTSGEKTNDTEPVTNKRTAYSGNRAVAQENEQEQGFAGTIPNFAEDVLKRTQIASEFNLDHVVARYQKEHGFADDIAQDHLREMIRFLSLASAASQHQKYYGMTGAIDELWHTFVIFTREYAAFCDAVAGHFLHHVPEVDGNMSEDTLDNYLAFLADYETVYREPAPTDYWPRPSGLHADAACKGCSACNGCTGQGCTLH